MTALVTMKERVVTIRALLEKQAPEMAKALSGAITPDKMVRMLMTDFQANPKLLECDRESILRCVMEAAQLNLVTGSAMGQAYLVPYGKKAQLVIGYKGLLAMAHRSGAVAAIQAKVVRQGDDFSYRFGTPTSVSHLPGRYDKLPLPELTHVYAIADLRSGGQQVEVMQRVECEAIRLRSRSRESGPWVTDYDAMCLKTVLRRLLRTVPQSTELQYAISEADRLEAVPPPPVGGDSAIDALGVEDGDSGQADETGADAPGPVTG